PDNWNIAQTVTVTAVDDHVVRSEECGVRKHTATSSDPAYNGIVIANLVAGIADNDSATPGVLITPTNGTTIVVEGGATDTYTVVLTSKPTANVIITLTADAQLSVTPATITFTPDNWNIAQTVTVTAVDDHVV